MGSLGKLSFRLWAWRVDASGEFRASNVAAFIIRIGFWGFLLKGTFKGFYKGPIIAL